MGLVQRTVEVDAELVAELEAEGGPGELSALLDWALKERRLGQAPIGFIARARHQAADPEGAAERARRWAEDNAEAIKAYNERIEREGVFGEDLRTW